MDSGPLHRWRTTGITSFVFWSLFLQYRVLGSDEIDTEERTTTPSIPDSWRRIDAELAENGTYYCYFRCMAKCFMEDGQGGNPETTCAQKCRNYKSENLCTPSDKSCWTTCHGLFEETGKKTELSAPQSVTVSYTRFPQPNPHEADLRWRPVVGATIYVVKYLDLSDKNDRSDPIFKISTRHSYHLVRGSLCSVYAFAVAGVSPYGVSQFSETVLLEAPTPVIATPSYSLISAEKINEPFLAYPDDPSSKADDSTVVVLIAFTPPPNWNLTDEITRVDANMHMLDAGTPRLSFNTDPIRVPGEAKFEVRLPGAVADTSAYCKFMFTVEKMFTKCNEEEASLYPPYTYNPRLNQTLPGLSVQINCQDIKNGGCNYNPAAILPSCGYKDVTTDVIHDEGSETAEVTIYFMPHDPYADRPVLWYNISYGEAEKGTNTSESILFNLTKIIGDIKLKNDTHNFSLPDLEVGKVYVVYICTVYDARAQDIPGDWNEFQRYAVDLTAFEGSPPTAPPVDDEIRLVVMVVVPLLIAMLVAAAVATLYISRKRRGKKLDQSRAEYSDGEDRYVTLKKRYDHWELPRQRLQIDSAQKLGSGAFGAVYKGKISGVLTKNRLSASVLAEHWMKAENCEVAVKMLPAYADEASKSDFLKEINLMKQLGYHERLVNMLACITSEDPLCLVVEYCSEGDLLNYLRKRRHYMAGLQEQGIDINNIGDTADIDFSMVLCKKDLISFAWQISVGLEYLGDRGFIHRDVAARNVLVAGEKRAKVGDFGLCRYSCSDPVYLSKGGRLPIKWMAPEAIKHYEFTSKSDVWSYGVLLFEIVTLGGSPYPGIQPQDMETLLESGKRMEQPDSCPYELYEVMLDCWRDDPQKRPTFSSLREGMRLMLEHITEDYYYMGLNQSRDYYNAAYQQDECSAPQQTETKTTVVAPRSRQMSVPANCKWSSDTPVEDAGPPSPSDTISFDESIDNNVFDTPPSPPLNVRRRERTPSATVESSNECAVPERKSSAPPPLPPRRRTRTLSSAGGGSVSSIDESFCTSPAFIAARRHDSTSSEKALLSPAYFGDKHGAFPKFFKFTTPSKLDPLPEALVVAAEEPKTGASSTVQNDGKNDV